MANSQKLIEVLRGETEIYKVLLDLAIKKTDVIIAGKIKELDKIVQMEKQLVKKLMELEGQREDILEKIDLEGEVTINDLIETVFPEEAENLKAIKYNLADILKKLNERNKLNAALLEQALEYVNYTIQTISQALENNDGIYGNNGNVKKYTSLIDKKA
ncbi:FlgN family protein [Thermoanaerobacter mathranii subsp. mathranii str. A3]|uniref:FlgN family protein n=1 Tax=Thermoanaerobacter mathranii subsp. mathranii (strain DSM 11426 / CCUG 53645 / CIP 108742 / A3) TaxID=583358 RepID=A0ABM5LNL0_THEM3|nr:flagellar protein FlgN [Thermoanaerobacter mathranii]ADH60315.1 FlgN family protein [Thermoanaerobacter mathranii subsp. mathranii str. A3]